jgi:hypothetical protein
MKTSLNRSRLACRAARWWSVVAFSRHAENCPECRAYFASVETLERSLRRDAAAWTAAIPEPSPGFERRLRNLGPSSPAPVRPAASRGWWLVATTATATAAIAVGFLISPRGASDRATQADAALLAAALETASRGFVETVIPSAGTMVADNPLQREFSAIRSDARSALSFLALNFLPSSGTSDGPAVSARPL